MAIDYVIEGKSNILVLSCVGENTILELSFVIRQLLDNSGLPDVIPILIETSEAINILDIEELSKMEVLIRQVGMRFKSSIALLVVSPQLVTPYHLLAAIIRSKLLRVKVFTSRDEAVSWLQVCTA